jgi:cytochrome c peroxidase
VSTGIFGDEGTRNAMALINLGYAPEFFWEGRSETLEEQVAFPITSPIEMAEEWPVLIEELEANDLYPPMFEAAYGSTHITEERVRKAIASFMRTMLSGAAKFDLERIGMYTYTDSESRGYDLFITEGGDPNYGADCFHCHGFGSGQFSDYSYRNNGLDEVFSDPGRMAVTGDPLDEGKFKVPTLRNIELTAPYMHDGRFNTLEEVIEHYNSGVVPSATLDPFMKFEEGLSLTDQDKEDLLNFLKCLTDTEFTTNEDFSDPHE